MSEQPHRPRFRPSILLAAAALLAACSAGAEAVRAERRTEQQEAKEAQLAALEARAAGGDLGAQMELASMYYDGRVVPRDRGRAAVWYRAAADQGLAEAYYSLGVLLEKGDGVPGDLAGAAAALSLIHI